MLPLFFYNCVVFEIDSAITRLRLAWAQKQRGLTPAMLVTDSGRAWKTRLAGASPREQALMTRYMAYLWGVDHDPLTLVNGRLIVRAAKRHGVIFTMRDAHDWELVQARHLAATRHFKSLPVAMPGYPTEVVMIKFEAVTLFRDAPGLHKVHAGTFYASPRLLVISDGVREVSFAWSAITAGQFLPYGFRFTFGATTYVIWTSDRFSFNATLANFLIRKVKHADH